MWHHHRCSLLLKLLIAKIDNQEYMQEASDLMEACRSRINKINQAAVFIRSEMVLPSEMHIFAVTRPISAARAGSDKDEELVVAKDAPWGVAVPAPPCWGPKVPRTPFLPHTEKTEHNILVRSS